MYDHKFVSNYNYETYQYIKYLDRIIWSHLLYISSKKLLLILFQVTDNKKIDVNICNIYHFSFSFLNIE